MPNFDSTVHGQRYSKVEDLNVKYIGNRKARISVVLRDHVPMTDGSYEPLGSQKLMTFTINPEDLLKSVPLRDIDTGELLGVDIELKTVFVGMNAIIRDEELKQYPDVPVTENVPVE